MKNSRRILALMLSLVMCATVLAACGPTAGPAGPGITQQPGAPQGTGGQGGGMMQQIEEGADHVFADHIDVIMDNNNVGTLNPMNPAANTSPTNWSLVMLFDRLLNRLDTGEYLPGLATEWHTDDYITFNFRLRQGVVFHNGDPFTAQDVANTIDLARESASLGAAQWHPIESYRIINDFEIEFTLGAMNVDFYFNLAMANAGILNKRAIDADPENGHMIATGAYKIERFVNNDYIVFLRNHDWWDDVENGGRRNIVTERITLRFVPEMSTRTIMMQNDESQLSFGTSAEDVILFQEDPDNFQVIPLVFNNPQGFSFNLRDPITGCPYFRQAVIHAIDKDEIAFFAASEWAKGVYDGGCGVWGYKTEFRNLDLPPIYQDQARARELLELSVYNGEEVEIAASNTTNIRAAQAMQAQLRDVGINTTILQLDAPGVATYMANPDGPHQMIFFNLVVNLSPFSARQVLYPGAAQTHRSGYNNPEVTQLFDDVASMLDRNDREVAFRRIQEIVYEDPPYVSVHWRINAIIAKAGIGGLIIPGDHHQTDMRGLFQIID